MSDKTAVRRKIEARAKKYAEESPLAAEESKNDACRMLAEVFWLHSKLIDEKASGDYNAEEVRTISSLASNAKRLLAELKITEAQTEDEEEL